MGNGDRERRDGADQRALLERALRKIDEMQAKLEAAEGAGEAARAMTQPIAVIGLGCRFPGGVDGPAAYWKLLCDGVDAVREVPPGRWDVDYFYDPDPDAPGKMYTRHGGFLDDIEHFDPRFFGIAPIEALAMDPQHRLLLEVSWEALEHAGQAASRLLGSKSGVFVGVYSDDFAHLRAEPGPEAVDTYFGMGIAHSMASGRLSYTLGLEGPSFTLDTACSSSLLTLHLACQSLRAGECDLALAGGASLILSPEGTMTATKARMLSPAGRCKTFDAAADGYIRGEGCGIAVLKRLSDAVANNDRIIAVVRGTATNADGRSSGVTAPNGRAQEAVIRAALANGGVAPETVDYVEAHGTGTSLGDPIELGGLAAALCRERPKERPLLIGSVKTNIGHLEATAGIAGFMKLALALSHGEIPRQLHLTELNPQFDWSSAPLEVVTEQTPWPRRGERRIGGVSAFGFSGSNVHMVLEEAPPVQPGAEAAQAAGRPSHLLALSAKDKAALRELAVRYEQHLATHPEQPLADVCFTANAGRSHFAHRLTVGADSTEQARERLAAFAKDGKAPGAISARMESGARPKVAFLFTGQGAQYAGMGRGLYDTQPTFRRALDRCDEILRAHLERPLLSVLYPRDGPESPINETMYTQPALVAVEWALSELWRSWGVEPTWVVGHSVGGYAAACVAGVFGIEDCLKLIAARGRLMQSLPRNGVMAAVFAPEERVAPVVADFADRVSVATINGPKATVVSGETEAVKAVLARLEGEGLKAKQLTVSHAFHSPLMEPILDQFESVAREVEYREPRIALVSDSTGRLLARGETPDAGYWRRHIREAVRFADALETLEREGAQTYLEIGPKPTLLGMARGVLPKDSAALIPSLKPGGGEQPGADWTPLLQGVAELYTRGVEIDWLGFDGDYARRRVELPTHPFQRQRFWDDSLGESNRLPGKASRGAAFRRPADAHPLLGARLESALEPLQFENQLAPDSPPFLAEHRFYGTAVFPAAAHLELAFAAGAEALAGDSFVLEDVAFHDALTLRQDRPRKTQVIVTPDETGGRFEVFSMADEAGGGSRWRRHSAGRLKRAEKTASPAVALDDIRARCTQSMPADGYYRRFGELGVDYGASFRGIAEIWRRDGEVLGRLELPEALAAEAEAYRIHPAFLDACLQLAGAGLFDDLERATANDIYMPTALAEAVVYERPGARLWGRVVIREGLTPGAPPAAAIVADVALLDDDGRAVAEFRGLRFERVNPEALLPPSAERVAELLYGVEWLDQALPEERDSAAGAWLIFADAGGVADAVAVRLTEGGATPVVVRAVDGAEGAAEGEILVSPDRREDFVRAVEEATQGEAPLTGVAFMWGLDAPDGGELTADELERAHERLCGGAVSLVQALDAVRRPAGQPAPCLYLVTRGAVDVANGAAPCPATAALWGLASVIALEHPELRAVRVDLSGASEPAELAAALGDELLSGSEENRVALTASGRSVARLARYEAPDEAAALPEDVLRADATYLITGGMGALGLRIARQLVEGGARHLALMGRSEPSAEARAAIEALEAEGAQVRAVTGDVSRAADVESVLGSIAEAMPPLRGVIHSAGVLDDSALLQQDWPRFARVFAPKAWGAWNLHRLTQDIDLDFFVMFSSIASLFGSRGQSNYAAANAFMDALAARRRGAGLPALSVNWGAWAVAGMAAELDERQLRQAVGVMTPALGAAAFARVLALTQRAASGLPAQLAVTPIAWKRFRQSYPVAVRWPFFLTLLEAEAGAETRAAVEEALDAQALLDAAPAERQTLLQSWLGAQIGGLLGLAAETLDADEPITNLGFDSLMAVEFRNQLESELGAAVSVVELLEGPSVAQLAERLLDGLGAAPAGAGAAADKDDAEWEEGEL